MVVDPGTGATRVGKFGWKAQEATLFDFTGDALVNEMGVTTPLFPDENCPQGNCALLAANPARTHPNVLNNGPIQSLTNFMTRLAPPPRVALTATAQAGQTLFAQIGCADCHVPTLQAGPSPIAAINGAMFSPFSDYLLHDMGTLGDGIVQNHAGPTEMRTSPLWGLRFQDTLLHDGRAHTVSDAILAHAGQGKPSRDRFASLTAAQKAQLLAFLSSL